MTRFSAESHFFHNHSSDSVIDPKISPEQALEKVLVQNGLGVCSHPGLHTTKVDPFESIGIFPISKLTPVYTHTEVDSLGLMPGYDIEKLELVCPHHRERITPHRYVREYPGEANETVAFGEFKDGEVFLWGSKLDIKITTKYVPEVYQRLGLTPS